MNAALGEMLLSDETPTEFTHDDSDADAACGLNMEHSQNEVLIQACTAKLMSARSVALQSGWVCLE